MRRVLSAAAVSMALLLTSGSMAGAATHPGTTVTGAGATFSLNMFEQWKSDFKKSTDVTVSYTGVGSGAGRTQLIAGNVDFAGSDVPADAAQTDQLKSKYGEFIYAPITAGPLAVFYKVQGFTGLKLTAPTIAKIFSGEITKWNDPAIEADNGGPGPNLPISVFVRSDKSGTSGVFTQYLADTAGNAWSHGFKEVFPTDNGQIGKAGTDGVANAVSATNGAIGYGEHSFAIERGLPEVLVKNGSDKWIAPEADAATAAIDDATINPDGTLKLKFVTTDPAAYPISTVSYVLAPTKLDSQKADNLKAFFEYALSAEGQGRAKQLGYAPLGPKVRAAANAQIAKIQTSAAPVAVASPEPVAAPAPAAAPTTAAPKAAPKPAAKPAPKAVAKAPAPVTKPVAKAPAPKVTPAPAARPTAQSVPKTAAAPKVAGATEEKAAAAAPDPNLATTGAASQLALLMAGGLLIFGGFAVATGRSRKAATSRT